MSVLQEICEKKKEHVATQQSQTALEELKAKIQDTPPPRGFIKHLKTAGEKGIALIAEVKKASPSKGIIREDFDPVNIAQTYQKAGAACLSVLTDTPYFQGSDSYFTAIRNAVDLPMLRKDFMVDPYQIYESRALGADCILIIMAALSTPEAKKLYDLSVSLGMDVLVEVHNAEELESALALNPQMVGVNNRNLKTLEVNVQTSFDLLQHMPANIIKIAESGLKDHETVSSLQEAGYAGFLIGESLMRSADIETATLKILGK